MIDTALQANRSGAGQCSSDLFVDGQELRTRQQRVPAGEREEHHVAGHRRRR